MMAPSLVLDTSFVVHIDAPMQFDRGEACEAPPQRPDPWKCPRCEGPVVTKDKRNQDGYVRRRKQCTHCAYRYTTHEVIA